MYSLCLNLSLSVSYGTFTIKEHDKPNCFSQKKYWKNKNMRTFFLYLASISVMSLLQTNYNNLFFFFHPISAMPLPHIFFPSISAMTLPQTNWNNFFPSYFSNAIATIPFHKFFFLFRNDMCTQFLSGRLLLLN